jgi:hypothetical protein
MSASAHDVRQRKRRTRRALARRRRIRRVKAEVLGALGGACAKCRSRRRLEVDHVDGCTWVQRKLNSEHRWYRFRAELRAGVRLRALCRRCNAALNQHTYGTRAERRAA